MSKTSIQKQGPLYLAVNGAEGLLQVVVGYEDLLLSSMKVHSPRRGVQILPLLIQQCLSLAGKTIEDIRAIACVNGPGSFTGLRITLSMCSGLAMARAIDVAEIPYLPLLAAGVPPSPGKEIWVITYARINTVYIQGFDGETKAPLGEGSSISVEELPHMLGKGPNKIFIGSGVRRYRSYLDRMVKGEFLPPYYDHPFSHVLLNMATTMPLHSPPLSPLYLRPSEAEENLENILKQRGLSPKKD